MSYGKTFVLWKNNGDRSDWVDTQAYPGLHFMQRLFLCFCHEVGQIAPSQGGGGQRVFGVFLYVYVPVSIAIYRQIAV